MDKTKLFPNKKNIYIIFLILLTFFIDRISKIKIIENFSDNIFFVNNFTNLDLIWNTGIGFGLLSSDSMLFYNLVSILVGFVIIVLFYITMISENLDKFIYSLIIGGALGNFYDRLTYNAVPDFIDIHYENYHWFTFNVADIFITLGVIIFIIKGFFVKN